MSTLPSPFPHPLGRWLSLLSHKHASPSSPPYRSKAELCAVPICQLEQLRMHVLPSPYKTQHTYIAFLPDNHGLCSVSAISYTCITHQFSSTVPQLTTKEVASWHLQCTAFLRQSPSQVSPWLVGPWAKGGRYQMQPALLHQLCEAATATKRTGKYMHS